MVLNGDENTVYETKTKQKQKFKKKNKQKQKNISFNSMSKCLKKYGLSFSCNFMLLM